MTKIDIVREYLDEYIDDIKEGTKSKLGLAKEIFADYPDIFKDAENVRSSIRRATGAGGSEEGTITTHEFKSTAKHARWTVPKSLAAPIPDFIFPDFKKVGIMADVHIPYHNNKAVMAAIEFFKKIEIDAILLNGDCIDFYQVHIHSCTEHF